MLVVCVDTKLSGHWRRLAKVGGISIKCVVGKMAESRTVAVAPLNGSKYVTWKIQRKMALMKEGLWKFVEGTEATPPSTDPSYKKFVERWDRALAIVVLSIDPTLLYLIGEPTNPKTVWTTLADQFHKTMCANKLQMKRKLHSLSLKEGDPVQEHIRQRSGHLPACKLARMIWGVGYRS